MQTLNADMPKFHSCVMRQKFISLFGRMANVKPAYLREMYHELTGDSSAASSEIESHINECVRQALESEDPDVVVDLRQHNKGHSSKYMEFWEACENYIRGNIKTAVDDRRHDPIEHLAIAMSVPDLLSEVSKKVEPGIPIPSVQWLRLQFWPKSPTAKTALQYTGRLKVKYMVQKRQMRKFHEDAHYASAIFRYEKEMAIKYRRFTTFVSLNDKHKVPVGDPGYPVASVERGKKVLVSVNKPFMVGDHDFTRSSLTPSVALFIEIPESTNGSFYHGQVCVGIKDSVFEASSTYRHTTELNNLLTTQNDSNPVLLLYTDGGPDHRVNFLSVQLSYIALFLTRDLDYLAAVRTPPYNSWKNPAECVMSELNLALQTVGVMRQKMSTATFEKVLEGCNSMKAIRSAAESHRGFQEEFKDSLQPATVLLSALFQRLKLKNKSFHIFPSSTSLEIDEFLSVLKQIQPDIVPTNCTKASSLTRLTQLKNFMDHCCHIRHYIFSIKKCGATHCTICKPPRLPKEIFNTLYHLPDPVRDGDVYKKFSDVYETNTTEKDRPSLQSSADKCDSGIPFNPSGQFAQNVARVLHCTECDKPRVLYSSCKLLTRHEKELDCTLNDVSYLCGTDLKDCIPDEINEAVRSEHILSRVFVRKNISCSSRIETPYFSSSCFSDVCIYCGSGDSLIPTNEANGYYPQCASCKSDSTKPGILKRKRKLVT